MKSLRRILAGVLVLVLCLSMTGCRMLEDMRETHGFWQEDGSLLVGETVYKPLPYSEFLSPDLQYVSKIYITKPDVPVLLSSMLGDTFFLSKDDVFMFYDGAATEIKPTDNGSLYFCRADRFDEMLSRIEADFVPKGYCYYYDKMVEDKENYILEGCYYSLTAQEVKAIDTVLTTVEPTELPEGTTLNYHQSVNLEACSEDLLFREYAYVLCIVNEKYYLLDDKNHLLLYSVPDAMYSTFQGIMKAAVEGEGKYDIEVFTEYYKSAS